MMRSRPTDRRPPCNDHSRPYRSWLRFIASTCWPRPNWSGPRSNGGRTAGKAGLVRGIAINLLGTALAPSYPALLGLSVVGGLADAIVFGLPLAVAGTVFTGEARRRAIGW